MTNEEDNAPKPTQQQDIIEGNVIISEEGENKYEIQNKKVDETTTSQRPIASGPQVDIVEEEGQLSSINEPQTDQGEGKHDDFIQKMGIYLSITEEKIEYAPYRVEETRVEPHRLSLVVLTQYL